MFLFENTLKRLAPDTSNNIYVHQSSDSTIGFRSFEHTRILVFSQPVGELFIDFAGQQVQANSMYIIPPTHLYSFTNISDNYYLVLDVDESQIGRKHKRLLYAVKYATHKALAHSGNEVFDYASLQNMLLNEQYNDQQKIKKICELIDANVKSMEIPNFRNLAAGYLTIAQQFLALLKRLQFSLDCCSVEDFAAQLSCSVRTLRRVCFDVFYCSPSYIIKYHLMLYGIYLLAQGQKTAEVAQQLGFSSIAAFDRFIKRFTNTTPGTLRQTLSK